MNWTGRLAGLLIRMRRALFDESTGYHPWPTTTLSMQNSQPFWHVREVPGVSYTNGLLRPLTRHFGPLATKSRRISVPLSVKATYVCKVSS